MRKLIAGRTTIECSLVIFDKDGTLIDQYKSLLELARARKNSVKKHVEVKAVELWEKMVGVDLKKVKIDEDGPLAKAPRREELLVASAAFYLNGFSWSEARQLAQTAYDEADDSMKPPYGMTLLKDVEKTLKQLEHRGLKLAIASTDTHKRTEEAFKALKIAQLFDSIVGSDDVTEGKPAPDMIIEILRTIKCTPEETVMVGDSISDMQMGKNAGVKACIGVPTGFTPQEKLQKMADIILSSVSELRVL